MVCYRPPPMSRIPRHLAVLAASLGLSLFIALRFPLVDPDEGRNAEVAREMARSGDLVIPHLAGLPYLDKPPLLFAAAAGPIALLGPTPLAARLPAIAASLVVLALLRWLARRRGDPDDGAWAMALTASAPLFAVIAAYVIFDMPLAAAITAVWVLVADEVERGPDPWRRTLAQLAVALGILTKGPVMLAWALGGSLAAAALMRSRAPLRWLGWAPGWVVTLALAGGWFAAALERHPEYLRYAFLEESLERMTSGSFAREQPWWFVPAVLAGGALPWSLATPWRRPERDATRVALGFVLFAAVFFTLSRSKLVTYLVPAMPALAWWAAECWRGGAASRRPLALRLAVFAFTPLLVLGGSPWLVAAARRTSGAPLAEALARAGARSVVHEDCYSPGSDFLGDRRSVVVSALGHPITSNYILRYRDRLRSRGQWTLADSVPEIAPDAWVRERRDRRPPPAGFEEFHRDERFVAYRPSKVQD